MAKVRLAIKNVNKELSLIVLMPSLLVFYLKPPFKFPENVNVHFRILPSNSDKNFDQQSKYSKHDQKISSWKVVKVFPAVRV